MRPELVGEEMLGTRGAITEHATWFCLIVQHKTATPYSSLGMPALRHLKEY